MVDSDFSRCPDAKPREHFLLENHETNSVAGTLAKPDYVLYYEGYERSDFGSAHVIIEAKLAQFDCNLPVEVLGQIGYYAKCVWEKQFTRTFVPVILLHGTKVDLCLFSRSGYSRVPLGRFIKDPKKHIEGFERTIATTIRKLWFFLIQPSERFGHFVNVSSKPRYLLFNREKRYATVKRAALDCDSSVRVTGRIDRKVEVSHRVAYLLNVRYQGEEAVLKLSWLPVKRQPEGVLYDLLNGGNHRVDCIPKVFRSGILVSDFLGYRLEFILMEHCGKPLIDERAGVYHRDISAGNITLREQEVFLIDWGYGKAIPDALDRRQKEKVNSDWGIDIDRLTVNEDARDGVTGTVYYMGIRVLMGYSNRSILDDIESLLYVLLHSISYVGSERSGFSKLEFAKVHNGSHAAMK
ncbi:hypothetical protein GGI15_000664 [Coemansia interrupta]|uniref:Protein kinase domain-containing protein n=1 Tax=Coemansia interrupta TaxID=1126814 RepID=A0A9W8LM62_9FUNG|nr:hypothetical protein GGI15_000664 [Coemansia interrupta]